MICTRGTKCREHSGCSSGCACDPDDGQGLPTPSSFVSSVLAGRSRAPLGVLSAWVILRLTTHICFQNSRAFIQLNL